MDIRDTYFKIYWDPSKRSPYAVMWGKQSDTGRGMEVILIANGKAIAPIEGEILRISWQAPGGDPGYVNAVLDSGHYYFDDLSGLFAVAGDIPAQLELQKGDKFLQSDTFTIPVLEPVAEGALLSSDNLTALQAALAQVSSLEERFDAAIAALTVDGEVITARAGHPSLNARLDANDTAVAGKAPQSDTYTKTEVDNKVAAKVYKTTKVNGKALSGDISLTAIDIGNTPAGGIAGITIQAALNELDSEKADKTTTYTKTEVDNKDAALATRITDLESRSPKKYGVRRTLSATSPLLTRLYDAVGKTAQVPTDDGAAVNDFDGIYPWSGIRECKLAGGRVTYKGDPGYDALTACDWMVEIPKFYLSIIQDATNRDITISQYQHAGFWLPQVFRTETGAELDRIYVARFKTGKDGTVDVSRPALFADNFRDLASFRTGAKAKGTGWQNIDLSYVQEVLHPLYMIESATLHSQDYLGAGLTGFRYVATDTAQLAETAVNRIVVTNSAATNYSVGEGICIGTSQGSENIAFDRTIVSKTALVDGINTEVVFGGAAVNIAVGNVLWQGAQKTGQTSSLTKPNGKLSGVSGRRPSKYRGLEDTFGNVFEWVDGVLISDRVAQVCRKPSLYASALTADYKAAGYTNHAVSGYPTEMGWDANYPEARFPVSIGAGTTTGYCDYYYQDAGLRGAFFGGASNNGTVAGLSCWLLNYAPSLVGWYIGSRLLFKPPV